MCGICGIATADGLRPVGEAQLNRMTRIMAHRGPDDTGSFREPGVGLGMRRLSIIDLETGQQPLFSEDGSVVLVCNGEIYNFKELRLRLQETGHVFKSRSDAEVVIHLYEDLGVECVNRLRGMFAFALWDRSKKRLMLARDRLGIKPLQYALGRDRSLLFASELKSLLASADIDTALNHHALRDLFTLGFVAPPSCLIKDVKQLLAGHFLVFQTGKATVKQYWDLSFGRPARQDRRMGADQWASALEEKLLETVRLHMRSDVPLGAWLSTGLDSSGICAMMAGMSGVPVEAFSIGFGGSAEADEINRLPTLDRIGGVNINGNRVVCGSEHFGLLPRVLWHREEPISSAVYIPHFRLAQATARKVKVVLTGEGADEILGGYPWYHADRMMRPFAVLPLRARQMLMDGLRVDRWWPWMRQVFLAPPEDELARFRHLIGIFHDGPPEGLFRGELATAMEKPGPGPEALSLPRGFNRWHPFTRLQYVDLKTRLNGFITWQLDRISMAHSLEARVPYLDHELVELCARIPVSLKMRGLREKYVLRQALKPWLPPEILRRRKRSLTAPNREWFMGRLPEFAVALLSQRALRLKGYFNPRVVRQLLDRHRAGSANLARPLMVILGFQLWDELFVQGTSHQDLCTPSPFPLDP